MNQQQWGKDIENKHRISMTMVTLAGSLSDANVIMKQ